MNQAVPNRITPVTARELAKAMRAAWRALWAETPSRDTVLVLLAHSALETGRWRSCHNWNLGNVKSTGKDGRDFTQFRCNEVFNGKTVWFDPPHPQTRFRAFPDLVSGVVDHLEFLRKGRYAKAFACAVKGDPSAYVEQLKAAGYFTADLAPYVHSVVAIFNEYRASTILSDDEDDAELHAEAAKAFAKQSDPTSPAFFSVEDSHGPKKDGEPNA